MCSCWSDNTIHSERKKKKQRKKNAGVQTKPNTAPHWCGEGWLGGWGEGVQEGGGRAKKKSGSVLTSREWNVRASPQHSPPTGGVCGQLHFIKTAATLHRPPPSRTLRV